MAQTLRDRVQALEAEVIQLRRQKQRETSSQSSRKGQRLKKNTFASPTLSSIELQRVPAHSDKLYEQLIHQTIHNTSRTSHDFRRHQRGSSTGTGILEATGGDVEHDADDTRQLVKAE